MDDALEVMEIKRPDAFEPLSERWDRVISGSASPNVFATSDWLQAWWARFGKGRDLWLLLVERRDGEPVGVAPFMVAPYRAAGVRLRALEFVGSDVPTCADHLELSCAPGWEREVAEAVGRHLLRNPQRWDVAQWTAVPEGSVSMGRLADLLDSNGRRGERVPSLPCPYLPLEASWEAYDGHLWRKFRDLKKYLRAVERSGGRFFQVRTDLELKRTLAELRRLNRLRVRSKGGVPSLERDDFFAFVDEICARFLQKGWLRLYALEVGDEIIAVNLNLAFATKVYGYMSGFDPTWTRHGVGTVLMRHAIRSSAEEGYQEYDFLRGAEEYKYRWTSCQRTAMTLRIVNRPLRYWAFAGGRLTARLCSVLRDRVSGRNSSHASEGRTAPESADRMAKGEL